MPYKVTGNCVYKKDTGAKVGCTKGDVNKYLAALHANANESINEKNNFVGGKGDNLSVSDIAKKHGVDIGKIKRELEIGKKVETEHTNDLSKATEIAMDHLTEFPDYYTRLNKMEKQAEKEETNENVKSLIKKLLREAFENSNITTIIKALGDEYIKQHNCTLWDINNGLCEEFAADVIERMGGYQDKLFELSTDMFCDQFDDIAHEWEGGVIETKTGLWSKRLLKMYGVPPIDLNLLHLNHHAWIFYNGKHYDAEAPQGVNKWFELPIFSRLINHAKNNTIS